MEELPKSREAAAYSHVRGPLEIGNWIIMLIRFASKAAFVLAIVGVAITQGRQEKQPLQLLSARGNEESNRMKPYFNDEEREILSHLRRILPAHSPATSTEIHGYFYAQYYSEANCSSGTGHVSYVEGYATGLCFQRSDETSGLPSGSVTQKCNPIGIYCPIMSLD